MQTVSHISGLHLPDIIQISGEDVNPYDSELNYSDCVDTYHRNKPLFRNLVCGYAMSPEIRKIFKTFYFIRLMNRFHLC